MFEEKMKELRSQIAEKEGVVETLATEIRGFLENDKLDEAKVKKEEREKAKGDLTELRENLALYEEQKEGQVAPKQERKNVTPQQTEYREALRDFFKSKGEIRDGVKFEGAEQKEAVITGDILERASNQVTSVEASPTIPSDISFVPQKEVKTVVDLKQFTNIFKATTANGKYPIVMKADDRFYSVEELASNPKLSEPQFNEVNWEVKTYRGDIPISQESIEDSAIDLVALVAQNVHEKKVNTTNHFISEALKSFAPKNISGVDDLKTIINKDLDPGYVNKAIVATQSFYNALDTLKDGNGRYLLQDSIISPSGKMILGMTVFVVPDKQLGVDGDAKAFIGDLSKAILFADRTDVTVRWRDNDIHGDYLKGAFRFGVVKADANAGYFVTYKAPAGGTGE